MSRINLPILFSQQDSRWASELLGFNTDASFNLGNYGCLDSCLAMIACYYGKKTDPSQMNSDLKAKNGFVQGGLYVWGAISKVYKDITERKIDTPSLLTDGQVNEIKSAVDAGFCVMIQLDYNPKTVANDTHYVVVVDYDPSDENNFTIADPLGGRTHSLKDYLGWFRPNARKTIEQYIIFEGKVPVVSAPDSAQGTFVDATTYGMLVDKSTKWDKTVAYLELGTNPKDTPFEDVQRVLAGWKSRLTDLQNQLNTAVTEQKNREEQVSRLKQQLLDSEKLQKDLSDKLNDALKNSTGAVGLYEGRIKQLQEQVDAIAKEKGGLNNTITALTNENTQLKAKVNDLLKAQTQGISLNEAILLLLYKIFRIKRS